MQILFTLMLMVASAHAEGVYFGVLDFNWKSPLTSEELASRDAGNGVKQSTISILKQQFGLQSITRSYGELVWVAPPLEAIGNIFTLSNQESTLNAFKLERAHVELKRDGKTLFAWNLNGQLDFRQDDDGQHFVAIRDPSLMRQIRMTASEEGFAELYVSGHDEQGRPFATSVRFPSLNEFLAFLDTRDSDSHCVRLLVSPL